MLMVGRVFDMNQKMRMRATPFRPRRANRDGVRQRAGLWPLRKKSGGSYDQE
jgi:hypothetical protein